MAGTVLSVLAADNSSAFASLGSLPNVRPEYLERITMLKTVVQNGNSPCDRSTLYRRTFSFNAVYVEIRSECLQVSYLQLMVCW